MTKEQATTQGVEQGDSTVKEIQSILYLLQESLERFKNEADRSYELFKIGTKTPLTEEIEGFVKNPLKSVIQSSANIDKQVKGLISKLVEQFLISKGEIIQNVSLTKNSNNDLYYSVVLKSDTIENRAAIFSFFELYNQLDIYYRYPVFFQFVPVELLGKINSASEINLTESGKSSHSTGQAQ